MNSYYILNNTTQKIELHFEKADYLALDDKMKTEIKSNFLFSRGAGAWVSRCKFPHLWRAEEIAKKLNLENAGTEGDRLTFAEQKAAEAEKAERRANYYDYKSDAAQKEGERLQAPINNMHGDIAFFTQPNINTSAGRAFTNKRNKMWAAWESGFESFKKSDYYDERAKVARETAKSAGGNVSIDFAQRRIDDAEKTIKAQTKNIKHYNDRLDAINAGTVLKHYNGEIITADEVQRWIDDAEQIIENNTEKALYYRAIIENKGGLKYSKENIKIGYIVKLSRWRDPVEVVGTGTKNITYKTSNGFTLTAAFAEITDVLKAEEKKQAAHPFKVGESFVYRGYDYKENKRTEETLTIIKATDKSVTLKRENGKTLLRRPTFRSFNNTWLLSFDDGANYVTRAALEV